VICKRNIFTVSGIAISFLVAIGGWMLTNRLIDIDAERLITSSSSFIINAPVADALGMYDVFGTNMSEADMVSILQNWNVRTGWRLHEPSQGQISMAEAIEVARDGMDFLHQHGLLPEKMLGFNSVSAQLVQNIHHHEDFLPERYSFWHIHSFNDYIFTTIELNAVTGQIWRIEIGVQMSFNDFVSPAAHIEVRHETITDILAAFMYTLDLHFDEIYIIDVSDPQDRYFEAVDPYIINIPVVWEEINLDDDTIILVEVEPFAPELTRTLISYIHYFADNHGKVEIYVTGVFTPENVLYLSYFRISLQL